MTHKSKEKLIYIYTDVAQKKERKTFVCMCTTWFDEIQQSDYPETKKSPRMGRVQYCCILGQKEKK